MTTSHVVSYRLSDTTYKQAIALYQSTHQKARLSHNAIFRSYVLEALASSSTTETLSEMKGLIGDLQQDLQRVQRSIIAMQNLMKLCFSQYLSSCLDSDDEKNELNNLLEDISYD
jgi:Mg2+ and Co2+ transporter CorA